MTHDCFRVIGDLHGHYQEVLKSLSFHHLHDITLICLGDLPLETAEDAAKLREFGQSLQKHKRVRFWALRGNHDSPALWATFSAPNIRLLQDWQPFTLGSAKILPVGGAIETTGQRGLTKKTDAELERLGPIDLLITH
jgi:predicted phosphodiesterase